MCVHIYIYAHVCVQRDENTKHKENRLHRERIIVNIK
jgi:hypothetical protein